jgi:two-component system, OmpR family, sensor histidine kinase CreC
VNIGLRILLGYFVIVALAALLLGRVFVQQVKPGVRQAMEDTLVDTANVLAELATDDLLAGRIDDGRFAQRIRALRGRDIGAEIWGFHKRTASYRITVTDANGIVVFDSAGRDLGRDNSRWNDVYRTLRGQYGARSTRDDPDDDASSVMYVAAPIYERGGDAKRRIAGVLTVSKPNRTIEPFIVRSQDVIVRWGFVLLGAALVIGIAAAWWLSRQLGALRRYADAVTAGERASLPSRGIDKPAGEFADLGRALETMRARLEGKQYVERYVHALTHELKSPLAAIRGSAELLEAPLPDGDRERFATSIGAQAQRMGEMVDKLLALAAVEHRQRIEQPEPVDPRELLRDAAGDVAAQAQAAGVRIEVEADEDVGALHGDRFLLRQMVDNLLDNAVSFSPRGGAVRVAASRQGDALRVVVADSGPGVPDYAVARVFERFYSLPRPATGARSSGLGLSFVREVAALHGGEASLRNRAGGGAEAEVLLPLGTS